MTEISSATVARLPIYLRALRDLRSAGVTRVSSGDLAELVGIQPALLRRDLSHFGSYGRRGVGYEVSVLLAEIGGQIDGAHDWRVVLVGAGNLGRAIAGHLAQRGFSLIGVFDIDPAVIGTTLSGVTVQPQQELDSALRDHAAEIGVIAVPAEAAQGACDQLVAAGVGSILNLAPVVLTHPEHTLVRTIDVALELQVLAFHEAHRVSSADRTDALTPPEGEILQ